MRPTLANWQYEANKGYGESDMPPELWAAQQAVIDLGERFSARRRELRRSYRVPQILYHYTDLRGLQGMLESFNMWLSDAAFMNDPLEGSWVHQRAVSLASKLLGETPLGATVLEQIEAQLAAPDLWDESVRADHDNPLSWAAFHNAVSPAYIASFTEKGDLLSQWRGYGAGGDGFSVGFDLKQLEFCQIETIPGEFAKPTLIKVEYDVDRQDAEILWVFSEIRAVFDAHIEDLSVSASATKRFTQLFLRVVREALDWLRWEFKSPHYEEEREWRLVANPHGWMRPKTRVSGSHIVPYLEMPLPQTADRPINQLAIPRIVLGPRCPPSAVRSIRVLLQNLAYPDVVRSQLALR